MGQLYRQEAVLLRQEAVLRLIQNYIQHSLLRKNDAIVRLAALVRIIGLVNISTHPRIQRRVQHLLLLFLLQQRPFPHEHTLL